MFTGIVEERGRVRRAGRRLEIAAAVVTTDAVEGASIAVNGVCLTVAERPDGALAFDLSAETLRRSTLGSLRQGDGVNLERPVTLLTRLGGHLVQGHVDAVGRVLGIRPEEGGASMRVAAPGLGRYLVEKGSVAVDGVSLTVAAVHGEEFEVALVPHTMTVTTLGQRAEGDEVNLEADILAKYVERMVGRGA